MAENIDAQGKRINCSKEQQQFWSEKVIKTGQAYHTQPKNESQKYANAINPECPDFKTN